MKRTVETRAALIETTKELLWERGFESTSPRDIQSRSGVGQGSFYHHFDSKARLASAALDEIEREMSADAETQLRVADPLQRIRSYLSAPRDALRGCRMGRLANEVAVLGDPHLRAPIARYFDRVTALIAEAIEEAQRGGALRRELDARTVAAALVAVVQGGYMLSRVHQNARAMDEATRGALALLDGCVNG